MFRSQLTPTTLRWSTLSTLRVKRAKKKNLQKPSLRLAAERVVERSNDRVSRVADWLSKRH
jgi:hypothetical protein